MKCFRAITALAVCLSVLFADLTWAGQQTFRGTVADENGQPLIGATVALWIENVPAAGAACDENGAFEFTAPASRANETAFLRISSIGYAVSEISVKSIPDFTNLKFNLISETASLQGVTVEANSSNTTETKSVQSKDEVTASANRSFTITNPLESIRGANVKRSGSVFGSLLELSGSRPEYQLNGMSLGKNPNHFGMFSNLTTGSVKRLETSDNTTDASAETPGVIEMLTDRSFQETSDGELVASALEGSARYRVASDKWYLDGAVRKSALDKLARAVKYETDRATIPPTNFQDITLSGGIRFSRELSLHLDQRLNQDFLAFNTGETSLNTEGVQTFQHTRSIATSLETKYQSPATSGHFRLGIERFKSEYRATAADATDPMAINVNLNDHGHRVSADAEVTQVLESMTVTSGIQVSEVQTPSTQVTQNNWNFQPPYATSDMPSYFQSELNEKYSSFDAQTKQRNAALYSNLEFELGEWKALVGARAQSIDQLQNGNSILFRAGVSRQIAKRTRISASVGQYAESPIEELIAPYQALIRANLTELNPIHTNMASVRIDHQMRGGAQFGVNLFAKQIDNLPALLPSSSGVAVSSADRRNIAGFGIDYENDHALSSVFGEKMALRASYSFTHTSASRDGADIYVANDSPHAFEVDSRYIFNENWSLGMQTFIRSGFRFTPRLNDQESALSAESMTYADYLQYENSARFPTHITINLSASYKTGPATVFASLGNVLNRANPIISAHDGFVYDSGILPSIGVKWEF